MRQWIALSLLCMSVLLLPISASAACESPIKFGALTWESGQFTSGVLKYIAEKGYGCTVEEVPGAGPALDTALSQNDIQVIGEQWVGRSPIMEQAIEQNKVAIIGDTLKGGATQGWYVPKYVLEENPGLRSYQDLPKYTELFKDPEDPSQSRFMNCPTGWTCEIFNTRLLKTTGLDRVFNNVHPGTGAALDAEISSAFEQHKPLLFYYWQPTGLMAKYDFAPLGFPAHNDACWQDLLLADGTMDCVSGFPVSPLGIAVSTPFIESNPELADVFKKIQFTSDELNGAILEMSESKRSGEEQALLFLRENPNVWQKWLSDEAATNLAAKLGISLTGDAIDNTAVNNNSANDNFASDNQLGLASSFPSWSLETPLNNTLASVVQNYGDVFRSISTMALTYLLLPIERLLTVIPPWLIIALVTVLGWFGVRKVWFALACGAGLFLIGAFGLWGALIDTFALLIVSVLVTVIIGIPIGIAMAGSQLLRKVVTPILDVMQTMPSFVYLIPVLMLFGIGKVPALFATIIYALPPLIRLTTLGITQVNHEMVEAGRSFGSTHLQLLIWIKLPQALPSIMAGVNQAVMMSLSMVVLASMIGAPGLGEDVLQSIQTLNIGQGLQAGTAIVIVAIIIDRITQAFGQGKRARQKTIDASRKSIG
ncbi:ABC transporter permease subunit [Psychrobacter sp. NG25]|uniref:glycine betaine ABC transporter substrate-binding protein n=1 Tax=Psychrobacter sp. NG25 TaxID=2782005 RepID=UPI001883AE8E|nr:glycine betaine ABC transporter substrate-binding protein [Psychrobacter sp. NG25]MBF0658866.1 ABC transporter permease subunit [Psychrobacter sp. NG25]